MQNSDLYAHAGLLLIGFIWAVFYYINRKIDGKESGRMAVVLSCAGAGIAVWIIRMADFKDATPETRLTLIIGTIIFPLIYTIFKLCKWIVRQKEEGAEANVHVIRKMKEKAFICVGIVGVITLFMVGKEYQAIKSEMYITEINSYFDREWTYYNKKEESFEHSWSPSYGATHDVPYYGMNASQISQTSLGPPDEEKKCLDYYALRPERRSVTYRWYDNKGKLEFSAYALAGKVISVTDFRN